MYSSHSVWTKSRTALVVGAGIGGLAAAVALRRAGWKVRVHERAASPRELGFGILLAPNALAALRELGVGGPLLDGESAGHGFELRRLDGRMIRRFQTSPAEMVVALRPELHGALLQAVGNDDLHLGSELQTFDSRHDTVYAVFSDGDDEGELLVGADGIRSVVRTILHPHEPAPRPSGFCAIRGVVHGASHHLGSLSGVGYLDAGIEAATIRAGTGDAVYWYMSLLERDVPADARTALALLEQRWKLFEAPLREIAAATAPGDIRFDRLMRRDPLARWGEGPVTLLGDAAHPLLPHTGQGAAQALEDAVALGLVLSSGRPLDAALRTYERVRQARTASFIKAGPRVARVTTTHSTTIAMARSLALKLVPERLAAAAARRLSSDPHRSLRTQHLEPSTWNLSDPE